MKKYLTFLFSTFSVLSVSAQSAIPNGNFEDWNQDSYETPTYYPQSSNQESFFRCQNSFNLIKTTDAYHGTYAIQLSTISSGTDTCGGYFLNATNANGDPSTWQGGIAYNQQATGIRGYYKYNFTSPDSGLIIVIFKQGGSAIGIYTFNLTGIHSTYTPFNFTFSPALTTAPDTIIFAAASSNLVVANGVPGSVLKLDSLSFTGVSSQPTQMNADFELWQTKSIDSPVDWYIDNGQGDGVLMTSDAVAGTHAVELQTYLGDQNGNPMARPGSISTGYWDNGCNCYLGGNPYSGIVDTLAFYYKYFPAQVTDSAQVYLTFLINGVVAGGASKLLPTSATYQYKEIPFTNGLPPDTVIVSLQSTTWEDSTVASVGGTFKVDEIHFKSQPLNTGINKNRFDDVRISFYPNPFKTTGFLEINPDMNLQGMEFRLYDGFGRMLKSTPIADHKMSITKDGLTKGFYFYEISKNSAIIKTGKIIIE